MTGQLHIDWTVCRGRGLCTELLDGVLERDEWGFPRAVGHGSDVPIPRGAESDAAEAVAMCPLGALRLSPSSLVEEREARSDPRP